MSNRLRDKRCLIVGGTSGIGLAAARRFLQEGARVIISGLNDAYGAASMQTLQGCGEVCFYPSEASSEYDAESLTWKT
jgi:NAD(P)-dependent dehydrogenase (short-subunit alcohol dehydrogenase family)